MYDQYKANRDEMPEDLRPQIPLTRKATEAFNIACKEKEGFEADESEALLGFLFGHATQRQFIYRHRWRQGDVVIWDNRSLMHCAVCNYGDQPRYMERTTGIGEQPV